MLYICTMRDYIIYLHHKRVRYICVQYVAALYIYTIRENVMSLYNTCYIIYLHHKRVRYTFVQYVAALYIYTIRENVISLYNA